MTAFQNELRAMLEQAGREAQADGSKTIEAQHVLLALAVQQETNAGRFLSAIGLDHGAIRAALDREFEHSLNVAGTSPKDSGFQRDAHTGLPATDLGPSVQHALERGLGDVRKAPTPAHVLLGILRAEVGTVPRALALAGLDRAALLTRVQEALVGDGR